MAPEGLLRQFSQFPKSKINNIIIIIITRYNRVYVIQISAVYYKLCQENFKSWLMSLSTGHPTNFSQVFEIADHATADMSLTLQFSAMNEQKHVQFLKREFKVCFLLLIRCL